MPDIPIKPGPDDEICGKCRYFKLRLDAPGKWTGVYVCKSVNANPDRKDPKDGKGIFYYRAACKFWEW